MLPEGDRWQYEIKYDGYRALAFKSGGKLHLRSRNDKDFAIRYARVLDGLCDCATYVVQPDTREA